MQGSERVKTPRTVNLYTRRHTVYLTERQERMVIEECDRRGITIAELVRRIVDGWAEVRLAKGTPALEERVKALELAVNDNGGRS